MKRLLTLFTNWLTPPYVSSRELLTATACAAIIAGCGTNNPLPSWVPVLGQVTALQVCSRVKVGDEQRPQVIAGLTAAANAAQDGNFDDALALVQTNVQGLTEADRQSIALLINEVRGQLDPTSIGFEHEYAKALGDVLVQCVNGLRSQDNDPNVPSIVTEWLDGGGAFIAALLGPKAAYAEDTLRADWFDKNGVPLASAAVVSKGESIFVETYVATGPNQTAPMNNADADFWVHINGDSVNCGARLAAGWTKYPVKVTANTKCSAEYKQESTMAPGRLRWRITFTAAGTYGEGKHAIDLRATGPVSGGLIFAGKQITVKAPYAHSTPIATPHAEIDQAICNGCVCTCSACVEPK